MLLTSQEPDNENTGLWVFSPIVNDETDDPLCPRWDMRPGLFSF